MQSVSSTGASLGGTFYPNGSSTSVRVEYGTSTAYGLQTAPVNIGSASAAPPVTQALSGLTSGTTYHFRFVATNAGGQALGADMTFTTAGQPPAPPTPPTPPAEAGRQLDLLDPLMRQDVGEQIAGR